MWNDTLSFLHHYSEKAWLLGIDGRIISEFKWQHIFLELKHPLSQVRCGCLNIYIQLLVCAHPFPIAFYNRRNRMSLLKKSISFLERLCHRLHNGANSKWDFSDFHSMSWIKFTQYFILQNSISNFLQKKEVVFQNSNWFKVWWPVPKTNLVEGSQGVWSVASNGWNYGLRTSSRDISWDHTRNAESVVPAQSSSTRSVQDPQVMWIHSKFLKIFLWNLHSKVQASSSNF